MTALIRQERVVNICFHGVGHPNRDLEVGEEKYWVTRAHFLSILDLVTGVPQVRISFDDSNDSDLEIALEALLERGLTAVFFVLAGRLGKTGSLNESGVRELARNGMTIGTHGMDHRPWRGMDEATTRRELVAARDILSDVVGKMIDLAALPLGRYDRRLLADLRRCSYRRVFTSDRSWSAADAWRQPRFSIRLEDSAQRVADDVLQPPSLGRELLQKTATSIKSLR